MDLLTASRRKRTALIRYAASIEECMTDYAQFQKHLGALGETAYTEPRLEWHETLIDSAFKTFVKNGSFKDALDVGFGTGYSLGKFKELGINATGITIDEQEVTAANALGYNVRLMDMAFLDFPDNSFDLVWCRHAIEHSPMPVIALLEFYRVLKVNGFMYIEVPSDQGIHLENTNHYSMLSDGAWQNLFQKVKMTLIYRGQFVGMVEYCDGSYQDIYWHYWLKKI